MIDNKYQLVQKLGKGGSSDVFLAKNSEGSEFAIKIIRKEKDKPTHGCVSELQKEQLVMEMVNAHPNILKCHDFTLDGFIIVNRKIAKINYNVLEFGKNGTLSANIRRNGGFSEHLTRFYASQVCSAVMYMHQCGMAHCDIKPQNILLDEHYNIKLADFGTCEIDTQGDSLCKQRKGTPKFMAPEVEDFSRTDSYDMYASDVYSLGVTIYYMLTGKTPDKLTANSDQASTNSIENIKAPVTTTTCENQGTLFSLGISGEFENLLEYMTHNDPAKRPSMVEVMDHPWFGLDYINVTPDEVYFNMSNCS